VAVVICAHCGAAAEGPFTFCPQCGTQQAAGGQGLIGRILNGKYRVLSELGAGSMGTVYLGEHVALKKKVALKVLHRDLQVSDEQLKRFQREGITAGQFEHPNAIQIFDFDRTDDGLHFLAMEYVKGVNLKQWLLQHGPMGAERVLELARLLLGTLAEAHEHGIVHRDLKPENLMIVPGADGALGLKVLDFGLSKLVSRPLDQSLLTMTGRVMGTPLYMAPEQWHGEEVDQRSDLYSVCLILYEMLVGKPPFKGNSLTETLVKSTTEAPPSLLDQQLAHPVPAGLDEVLQRGLAKAREDRFDSAAAMLAAIDAIELGRTATRRRRPRAAPTAGKKGPRPKAGLPRWWLGVAAGAVVVLGTGSWWLLAAGKDEGRAAPLVSLRAADARTDEERSYLVLLADARGELRRGNPAAALNGVDRAMHLPCVDAEAFAVRAAIYRRQRDPATALADYQEALQRLPNYAKATAGIAWVKFEAGDLAGAEAGFRAAMAQDANEPDGFAGLSALLCKKGDAAGARQVLDAVATRFAGDADIHYYRGTAQLQLRDFDAAMQSFVQCKRSDPSLWQALEGLGDVYQAQQNAAAAEPQYRQALAAAQTASSTAVSVRRKLAELLLAAQRFADADEVLKPVLQGKVEDGNLLALHGLTALGNGDAAAATAAFEQALEHGVESPADVHLLLSTLQLENGAWQTAARHAEQAATAGGAPTGATAGAFRNWGLALFRLEDFSNAAARLEQAVQLDAKDKLARFTLGVLYMDYLQDEAKAVEQFRGYQQCGGDDPKVADWLRRLQK
jgi:serine/threonine-protein kinase